MNDAWSSYKRKEKAVKVLFDAILEQLPGLKLRMKAIGAGEGSLIHTACDSFLTSVLILCLNYKTEAS